jgi:RNA polymerase sigma factor (sigma-70 family)
MERILIVDDETPLAEALSELFETENITAATAGDRADAERMMLAEHFPVDLDALHEQMRAVLFSFPMRRFGLGAHDAEDVVQQAWCLFLEKRACIRQPRAWLSGTVANLCRQRLEDRHRMIPTEAAFLEDIADARARAADAAIAVHTALAAADERARQLCFLIGLENRSYEEVSARLGIPVGSVGPLYIRAKAKLRKLLAN